MVVSLLRAEDSILGLCKNMQANKNFSSIHYAYTEIHKEMFLVAFHWSVGGVVISMPFLWAVTSMAFSAYERRGKPINRVMTVMVSQSQSFNQFRAAEVDKRFSAMVPIVL